MENKETMKVSYDLFQIPSVTSTSGVQLENKSQDQSMKDVKLDPFWTFFFILFMDYIRAFTTLNKLLEKTFGLVF